MHLLRFAHLPVSSDMEGGLSQYARVTFVFSTGHVKDSLSLL
ncbi:MAG: hypothetical protein V1718_00750 [archaeon]